MVTITGKLTRGGQPIQVSRQTYVTLVFVPEGESDAKPSKPYYNATFDHATGSYRVEIPAGKYRTNVILADPSKKTQPKIPPPGAAQKVHELLKNQQLDIEVPN